MNCETTNCKTLAACVAVLLSLAVARPTRGDNAGQEDLDKALDAKITAKSYEDLEKVVELCESALKKGLDEENEAFATKLVTSTLIDHARRIVRPILQQRPPAREWNMLRKQALEKLDKALKFDDDIGEAHTLRAQLHALPGGDRRKARESADKAVRLAGSDKRRLSDALLLRGELARDDERKLADFNQAVIIDPENVKALQTRGLYHLGESDYDKAKADLQKLAELDSKNLMAHHGLAEIHTMAEEYDEALKHLEKASEIDPESPLNYSLRARIHVMKGDKKAALEDLNKAILAQPRNIGTLMARAQLQLQEGNIDAAKKDVERVLLIRPGMTQAVLLRILIAAEEGNFGSAVSDMRKLLQTDPTNIPWRLQLAAFLSADKRPRSAIEVLTGILKDEPDNAEALRNRGDAQLSIGKHAEAIKDYEEALKINPDDSGVLNNLAWVLATSPDDKLRDGKRSIELGTKACELEEYKRPHILSTLAAGYAETGDFETAKKWSSKAVELEKDEEVLKQLKDELKSYEEEKPWRELQQVEEKPEPARGGGSFEL